jgi:hypothetical protein
MDGGGTTTGTWEVESCRERRPRAASGDPQGCGEVEQRMEQLPEQRPRSPKRPGARMHGSCLGSLVALHSAGRLEWFSPFSC